MSRAPWIAAAATAGYFVATAGVFQLFNWGVPRAVEQVLSLLVSPAVLAMGLWTPLLRRFGWARGEWFSAPTLPGFVLLTLGYSLLAFVLATLLVRLLHR
jgi:hypothetical protein